jgi:RNA polymerase sigma-70 factor (ECF subfamily)
VQDEFCVLVDRCIAGEPGAILEWVERYQGPVFGLCLKMVRHRQDAEDLTQESLIRALRSLGHWDRARPFLPWLLTIAGNRCRTLLARRTARPPTTPLVDVLPDTAGDDEPARRLAEELLLALEDVRAEYRMAFMLFHQQQMSYASIAEKLERPLGTVKTWVHRARREVIQRLSQRGVLAEVRDELRCV